MTQYGRSLISYSEALSIVRDLAAKKRGGAEEVEVSLAASVGRVVARDYYSDRNIPSFSNSSMDGFAVNSKFLSNSQAKSKERLEVLGSISAGDRPPQVSSGVGAWEIMTGAPLPEGFDAVIKVEDVEVLRNDRGHPKEIILNSPVESGQHCRAPGEDFQAGSLILKSGTWITPEYILGLAALGISRVKVVKRPKVVVISTGSELVSQTDSPPEPRGESQVENSYKIQNSTAPFLKAVLERLGAQVSFTEAVSDEPKLFVELIRRVLSENPDLVITTGGVSMGKHDFVKAALVEMGADLCFHKVLMRPGKPNLLMAFPGGPTVFGLPGNPVSTVVGLRFLVEPYLREWMGRPQERAWKVRLTEEVHYPKELCCFFKAVLRMGHSEEHGKEGARVSVLPGQASFMVSPLLEANAWVVLQEIQGEWVDVYPLYSMEIDHKSELYNSGASGVHRGSSTRGCCQ